MRLIDADEAEEQVRQTQILTKTERDLLVLALNRTPTYDPPNDPLTLEELRTMEGEPVWVERSDGAPGRWAVVGNFTNPYGVYFGAAAGNMRLPYEDCGRAWRAYRRKPEEGTV